MSSYIQEIINKFVQEHNLEIKELNSLSYLSYEIKPYNLLTILNFLKTSESLRFTILTDLFASDFPARNDRFEIVYNLLSLKLNKRLILKINTADNIKIESVTSIFSCACWYEREIFDMFGIRFDNSPDMRRILTDYVFVGHPLRKDFPLTGYLQVTYDDQLEQVVYEPVKLTQEYRNFDFGSPWLGPRTLPGDEKVRLNDKKANE